MAEQKSSTWSQLKKELGALDARELIELVGELYKLNQDNKVFLISRLNQGNVDELLEPYRRIIKREFNPDRGYPNIRLSVAKKALNDFKKASTNPMAVADLMIYYVEQGVACTNRYGDIDERFYSSLASVYADAITLIRKMGKPGVIEHFRPRLKQIVKDTQGIGWGFHDELNDMYYNEYPPE